jgi:predicted deacetylase
MVAETKQPAVLLASIHDVSPLTLEACREAVRLLHDTAGLQPGDLTLLAIPHHESRIRLDHDPATVRWLRELADAGATIVLHGLTHRMSRATWNPAAWPWAYGFARGQGELYPVTADEAERRLSRGREILTLAGLPEAARCLVPPAWLLSSGARKAVDTLGFEWIELLDGIHTPHGVRAGRRLIGWGSLNAIEAVATTAFAALQRRRSPADLRMAVHPADMYRPVVRRSIAKTLRRLRDRWVPLGYREYLSRRADIAASGPRSNLPQ